MKVYFATTHDFHLVAEAGVRYCLVSFYHLPKPTRRDLEKLGRFRKVIIDSGLFTLMWGVAADKPFTEKDARDWQDRYVDYINSTPFTNATFVEMDVQKKLGSEIAWEMRKDLKARVKAPIINVYHLEDGNPDKLIDFSDHIAISQPELREAVTVKSRKQITAYIARKAQSKGKRAHLLGLAEKEYLRLFRWCDTCDSTSWSGIFRFGSIMQRGMLIWDQNKRLNMAQIRATYGNETGSRKSTLEDRIWVAMLSLHNYRTYAGDQS